MSVRGIIEVLKKSVFKENSLTGKEVTRKEVEKDTGYKQETVKLLLKEMRRKKILKSVKDRGRSVYKPTKKAYLLIFLIRKLEELGINDVPHFLTEFSENKLKVVDSIRRGKRTLKKISEDTGLNVRSVSLHVKDLIGEEIVKKKESLFYLTERGKRITDCVKRLKRLL